MAAAAVLALYVAASVSALFWLRPMEPAESLRLMVLMTPVRLAALAGLWTVARRERLSLGFDWSGDPRAAVGHAAAMLLLWAVFLAESAGAAWAWPQRLAGVAVAVTVGAFEEFAFRGVVLELCRRRWPDAMAAVASALAFTLFHCRPQSVPAWPHVFLTGAVFAHLRLRGLGLGWLAAIHAAVDAMFFFARDRGVQDYGPAYAVFLAGLFLYAALTAPGFEITRTAWVKRSRGPQ